MAVIWFWDGIVITGIFFNIQNKVFSKLHLEIGGQFTQTNKKQPHVLHFKNNIYYFIL